MNLAFEDVRSDCGVCAEPGKKHNTASRCAELEPVGKHPSVARKCSSKQQGTLARNRLLTQ